MKEPIGDQDTGKCEKCWKIKKVRKVSCYHPSTQKTKYHKICARCILQLINNYFDETKSGSW